jgi:predicted peptidase
MKPARAAALLAALVLALGTRAFAGPVPTGFLLKVIKVSGKTYNYSVFVPREYDPKKKWPCILFLHGLGEAGVDGMKPIGQGLGPAIQLEPEKWPFIVVFPQRPIGFIEWEQYDDLALAALQKAREDYAIDAARLYLTGLSQGGHGTWTIAARHPEMWAAIAPIAGYWDPTVLSFKVRLTWPTPIFSGKPEDLARALKDMPVWTFHGDADDIVPVGQTRDVVKALEAAGGHPKLTIYSGVGHNSWDRAYRTEDLAAWLLRHARH